MKRNTVNINEEERAEFTKACAHDFLDMSGSEWIEQWGMYFTADELYMIANAVYGTIQHVQEDVEAMRRKHDEE